MTSFGTRTIYYWSLECTEKKELCLAQIRVWSGWGSLVVELVLASTPGTGDTWSANPVNAENLSFTVSLSLGLPLFTALLFISTILLLWNISVLQVSPETHVCYTWLQLRMHLNFQMCSDSGFLFPDISSFSYRPEIHSALGLQRQCN